MEKGNNEEKPPHAWVEHTLVRTTERNERLEEENRQLKETNLKIEISFTGNLNNNNTNEPLLFFLVIKLSVYCFHNWLVSEEKKIVSILRFPLSL